jgi:spore coat protein U-like protein
MKPGLPIIAITFLVLSLAAAPAFAASVSSSIGVSATVESGCLVVASPGSGAEVSGKAAISVNCTNPTAYSVRFSSAAAKRMTVVGGKVTGSRSALLDYVLASGLAGKVDGGATASPDAAEGTWSLDPHTLAKEMLKARVRVDRSATERLYPDTITVTITY